MRKFIHCFLLLLIGNLVAIAQVNLTPGGTMDTIFDRFGNQYQLYQLMVKENSPSSTTNSIQAVCSSTSYFNLYFEAGCGMDLQNDPVHAARRAVLCKVFEDLSNFIISPLYSNGKKVNIWVRNINNLNVANTNTFLGLASGYYQLPFSPNHGGIADNEIWKTIHTGIDSYVNTTIPLESNGAGSNQAGAFYHGMIALNFNTDPNNNAVSLYNWQTNMNLNTIPYNYFDLYTVVLHEITHALGLGSLIDAEGNSKFHESQQYFSRFDTALKTNDGANFLLTNDINDNALYDYSFNPAVNLDVLHPNTNSCVTDITNCSSAIKFSTTTNSYIPVYTPNCFEPASSLSHFEDSLFPTCTNNNGDDNYFVMCNSGNSGVFRRYYTPEERETLCQLGYTVKPFYGNTSIYQAYYNFGGGNCQGINVAGVDDGIVASDGSFVYNTLENVAINLSGALLLSNDINASIFNDLQDLSEIPGLPTSLSVTTGSSSDQITFLSEVSGVHVLRYVPSNSSGTQYGNITYVYVNVLPDLTDVICDPITPECDFVANGNFEENNDYLTQPNNTQFERACGWYKAGNEYPSYYLLNNIDPYQSVPCNRYGFEPDNIPGNRGYAGISMYEYGDNSIISGIIATTLVMPLSPNTTYLLSFDVSLSEFIKYRYSQLRGFVSSSGPMSINSSVITNSVLSTGILLSNPEFVNTTNGWKKLKFTFTTNQYQTNLDHLYIGALNNPPVHPGSLPQLVQGCPTNQFLVGPYGSYYYIDNVSIIPQSTITGPDTICLNGQTVTYFSNPIGNWSSSNNAIADIDPHGVLTPHHSGTVIITSTSLDSCSFSTTKTVTIYNPQELPAFNFPTTICINTPAPILPAVSSNNIPGTWTSNNVSNTQTGTYVFHPTNGCSPDLVQTIQVINGGSMVTNIDDIYISSGTTSVYSILSNDMLNGTIPATTVSPITIIITSTNNNSITINANGTLNIPPGLAIGSSFLINYKLQGQCFASNVTKIIIHIIDSNITGALQREGLNTCYSANPFATATSLLDHVHIGNVQANQGNVTFTNVIAPPGFSINPNGLISIPANTLPGTYHFSYDLCPGNGGAGCVTGLIYQIDVNTTVRANPDIFYFSDGGIFLGSNHANNDNNIITEDDYAVDCALNSANSFGQAILNGTVGNLIITQTALDGLFHINENTGLILSEASDIDPGYYNFQYSICDINYPNVICSTTQGLVEVASNNGARMSNLNGISNKILLGGITIIPNPSDGLFNIVFEKEMQKASVKIYTMLGQELFNDAIIQSKQVTVDLSNFSDGTYLLQIDGNGTRVNKLIIKN